MDIGGEVLCGRLFSPRPFEFSLLSGWGAAAAPMGKDLKPKHRMPATAQLPRPDTSGQSRSLPYLPAPKRARSRTSTVP